jgi:predicted ABC-type sugar transport system permease subunit
MIKVGSNLTAAQIAALNGNQGVPLVQDAVTGVVYGSDGVARINGNPSTGEKYRMVC